MKKIYVGHYVGHFETSSPHFQHQKKRSAPKNYFTGYLKAEEPDAQRFLEKGRKLRPIGPK